MSSVLTGLLISAIVGTVLGAGTEVANSFISANAQAAANKANRLIHEQDLAFNSAEAQKDRNFQLEMANTAHQREVADLKAAGLNPWLSVSGAGASSGVNSSAAQASSGPNIKSEAVDLSALASTLSSVKDLALIFALGQKYTGGSGKK